MGNELNNDEPWNKCKRCKKPAKSGLRCITCGNISHKCCLPGIKNVVYIDSQTINCCAEIQSSSVNKESNSNPSRESNQNLGPNNDCIAEIRIKFLEELLVHKDSIILNQEIAVKALQSQVDLLNEKLTTISTSIANKKDEYISVPGCSTSHSNFTKSNPRQKFVPANISAAIHEANATNICSEIINLNKTETAYATVLRKNIKPRNILVGTMCNGDQGLKAATTMSNVKYFHSTNWKPHTTLNEVERHLKKIDPAIEVEQLNSRNPEKYASFKVTAPTTVAPKLLRAEVWPESVFLNEFFRSRRKLQESEEHPPQL